MFGEPPIKFHPTVWIGNLISRLEQKLYSQDGLHSKINGFILVVVVISLSGFVAFILQEFFQNTFHPTVSLVLISLCASTTIAFRSLMNHARPILKALCSFNLVKARRELSMIVGRDTSALTRSEVSRAAVEAVAESLGDGIVSPLFWFALFGLPGAFIYRAVNTMDSMLGYKSDKYINFGWAAARVDDIANYVPARLIAFPSIVLASLFIRSKHSIINVISHSFRFQGKHLSPNAGWMEAPAARIVDVSLGGVNYYKERRVEYPQLNPGGQCARPRHLKRCMVLISFSAIIAAGLLTVLFSVFL